MSAGICFRAEPSAADQDKWSYCFSSFGVTAFYERRGLVNKMRGAIQVADATDLPAEPKLIVLQPQDGRYIQGDTDLAGFVHPDDAIYFFGGNHDNMSDDPDLAGRVPDSVVFIPRVKHNFHSPMAGAVVLWDRYMKRDGFG